MRAVPRMKKQAWTILAMMGLTLIGCAPKTKTDTVVDVLKKESSAWERESNKVAQGVTEDIVQISRKINKDIEEIR